MIDHLPARCPLCGASVSRSRFAELQAKIHDEERAKAEVAMTAARAEMERGHRDQMEAQAAEFRVAQAQLDLGRAAEVAAERSRLEGEFAHRLDVGILTAVRQSTAPLEAALSAETEEKSQLSKLVEELKDALNSAATDRQTAIDAARAASESEAAESMEQLKVKIAEYNEDRSRLAARVKDFEERLSASVAAKDAEAQAKHEAEERRHQEELTRTRSALEKDRDEQLRKTNLEHLDSTQRLQKQVTELQRQLDKRSSDEIGRTAEADLYQALQDEFQDDRVFRVGAGDEGADIIVEVMSRGESCGKIVVDSKNRKAWQNRYIDKLVHDRDNAKADHAVLATSVFPSGAKDLFLRDGVVVVRPNAVLAIVQMLRAFLVATHVKRLSAHQRTEKATKVYEFINSTGFRQSLATALRASDQLADLDVDEKRAHDNLWRKRGALEREIHLTIRNVEGRLSEIVEAPSDALADRGASRSA